MANTWEYITTENQKETTEEITTEIVWTKWLEKRFPETTDTLIIVSKKHMSDMTNGLK